MLSEAEVDVDVEIIVGFHGVGTRVKIYKKMDIGILGERAVECGGGGVVCSCGCVEAVE